MIFAIRACKVLRLGFVTSLGVLVRSVEKGLLTAEDGKRLLRGLASYGRFRPTLIEEVLQQIEEISHGKGTENR